MANFSLESKKAMLSNCLWSRLSRKNWHPFTCKFSTIDLDMDRSISAVSSGEFKVSAMV